MRPNFLVKTAKHFFHLQLIKLPFFKMPEQAASTTIWASVGHELEGIGGLYLEDCQDATPGEPGMPNNRGYMPYALNADHAEQLVKP